MLLFDRFELFGFPQTTYICDRKVQLKSLKHMITSRKISQVNVFAGSPWEVASVKSLLNAPWEVESVKQLLKSAYITASTEDKGNGIHVSVPCQQYTAAMRVISNRKAL